MGKYRRKHYAIDKLPEDVKNDVDEMIKADFTYSDICLLYTSDAADD